MHDSILLNSLPKKFRDFIKIFKISYYAHFDDFFMIENCDLELMSWGNSAKVNAISIQVHIDFILQGLSLNLHKDLDGTEILELFLGYIDYALSSDAMRTTFKNYFDLLMINLENLNSVLFTTVIKHCPSNFPENYFRQIYSELVLTAQRKNLNFRIKSKNSRNWFKIYVALTKKFGVIIPYDKFKPIFFVNQHDNILDIIIMLQPILAAIARHDAVDFSKQFTFAADRFVGFFAYKDAIYYWIDRFIKSDKSFKAIGPSIPPRLTELADAVYAKLVFEFSSNPKKFMSECFSKQLFNLPELIFMFSPLARNSLPNKTEQFNFLAQLCNVRSFDSDYKRHILFLAAFPLTLAEIREHVVPLVLYTNENIIIQGLLFILEVVESAPTDFQEIWRVPLHLPNISRDFKSPFLLDAGRLILARNFNILPSSTLCNSFFKEESDYRDLGWFMSFYINLYRPDLGPDFKIKILDSNE